jgi:hypothetical protein
MCSILLRILLDLARLALVLVIANPALGSALFEGAFLTAAIMSFNVRCLLDLVLGFMLLAPFLWYEMFVL